MKRESNLRGSPWKCVHMMLDVQIDHACGGQGLAMHLRARLARNRMYSHNNQEVFPPCKRFNISHSAQVII